MMLEWFEDRLAAVRGAAPVREQGWTFVLAPPATEEDIRRCEADIGLPLPPSYRAFLRRWDGASLFRRETRSSDGRSFVNAEFGIQGTHGLPAFHRQLRDLRWESGEEWGPLLAFCSIPATGGDYCALNPEHTTTDGEYAVVDCFHELRVRCWWRAVVAPSFDVWLERAFSAALRGADPHYWLNTPELRAIYRECQEEDMREAAEVQRRRNKEAERGH